MMNFKNGYMKSLYEDILERVRNFKFSDTFDDFEDETEIIENKNSIVDDNPVLDVRAAKRNVQMSKTATH
jgi:hypothetical protein